jgi:glycosyltransferase involved in cell wall biosynthesis
MSKPRIAFISTMHGAPWGGSENLWGKTALRLLEEGQAEVFAKVNWHPDNSPHLDNLAKAGAEIERIPPRRFPIRVMRSALRMNPEPFLKRVRPDLVIISQGAHFDGAAPMIECSDRNLRYAPVCHCYAEGFVFADTHTEPLRRGYEEALMTYWVSKANLRDTRRLIAAPLEHAKIVRSPHAVSYDSAPVWPQVRDGVYRLACVARLETTIKGFDVLFDVLRQPKWKERPLELNIYGHGPNEISLHRLKEMYGLDKVNFAGVTSNVEKIWEQNHGLILTSRWEGLPAVVLETMLCGRICIVTDVGGNAELMTDNETGFVASAPKTELVDEALERAWNRRAEWHEMGQKAAIQIREELPPDPVGVFRDEILSLIK